MASGSGKHGLSGDGEFNFFEGSSKKLKTHDPSGICYIKTNLSAEPLICSRHNCVQGSFKNGVVVTFSIKRNGMAYRECDGCKKHTGEKDIKVSLSPISSKLMGLLISLDRILYTINLYYLC